MARSLNIPAIVGLHDISTRLETGRTVLLDGYHGLLVLDPTEQTLGEYEELSRRKQRIEAGLVNLCARRPRPRRMATISCCRRTSSCLTTSRW